MEANREFLDSRDSPLEFLLHRSQYLRILSSSPIATSEPSPALTYASANLLPLQHRYPHDIPKLINCILYGGSPESLASSYPEFATPAIHTCLETAFTREYCAQQQVSQLAPLKVVSNIGGGVALPRIEKGKKIMKERKGDWSHTEEIPASLFSYRHCWLLSYRLFLGGNSAITRELLSLHFHLSSFEGAGNGD